MTVDVKVPVLAESVPDATLLEWRKQPGDTVDRDEILIELETDKIVLEVPAPEAGVLAEILKQTGDTVLSQEVLARIEPNAAASSAASSEIAANPAATAPASVSAAPEVGAPASTTASERLSPAVRRLVEEHDLDPSTISGTGRDGRLTKGDVLAHLEAATQSAESGAASAAIPAEPGAIPAEPGATPAGPGAATRARTAPPASMPAPTPVRAPAESVSAAPVPGSRDERREPMSRLRQRIAERLVEAQHTAAILTTFNEIDMQPVMALRARHKEGFERRHGVRLGFMSFFARAAVQALRRFPAVNARIDGGDIVHHDYCDIGVAVGSPRGLVVPILRNVETMSFAEIEARIAEFGAKARDGTLSIDDMRGGTFTISNGGVFGSLLSTPILNPPQSGILGMHKTEDRPVAVDGEVVIRPMMYVALSYDHRIIDGREAVQFLVCVKEAIEDPARLLLDV
ncbi:MAG: 2-oxoglutarate dehydrogenase complex dihydrolipoyllysine-residue succinyltransferase [Thiotrichales bacterium]|nr:2-oxoglutarate dehydrogenase complex dihydrolipoyllysine-residue succinyltransferase [Thiotrichales bacterium]